MRRGFFRLTLVWWGIGLLGTAGFAVWSGGNPVALHHPDGLARPPELPERVCLRGAWSDRAGSALELVPPKDSRVGEALSDRVRSWMSTPPMGPPIAEDEQRVTLRFSGPLWAHYEERGRIDRLLGDRFELDFASLVQCSTFWSEKASEAAARWEAQAVPGYRHAPVRQTWAIAALGALLWTLFLWLGYGLASWVARGFRS